MNSGVSGWVDLANGFDLVLSFFENFGWCPKLAWMFVILNVFLILSVPQVPSRSNGYVERVGGKHEILIGTLNFPNASP